MPNESVPEFAETVGKDMTDPIWEQPDGTWTTASFVVRSLCTAPEVSPAELYFILHSLGIDERFKDHWAHHTFFEEAGIPAQAKRAIDRSRDGWIALTADHAWAKGDVAEAKRRYEESIARRDSSVLAGVGGLVRLCFVEGEYAKCIDLFRGTCPPHEYYEEYDRILNAKMKDMPSEEKGTNWNKELRRLQRKHQGRSPYFLTKAKYMCRAIVAAAVRADAIDTELRGMISDFFEVEPVQVDELTQALGDSNCETEINRLAKQLTPKSLSSGRTLETLRLEGSTELAQRLCERIPLSSGFIGAAVKHLDAYLDSGEVERLDEMVIAGSPFGVAEADRLILEAALRNCNERISSVPDLHLSLLRRFSPICHYPEYDFLADYLAVMKLTQAQAEPGDIISAILDVQWYKTQYSIDYTGLNGIQGGLGKPEISKHREWLEIILSEHPTVVDREHWASREAALDAIHRAYTFLRERYNEVRNEERWVSEARLGDALAELFGETEVVRHARPLWLGRQHLDYFLPQYQLAVEYMGAQHYRAVDLFGGETALKETQARDERKRELCERMGVTLVYVTHEENVGKRAREIHAQFGRG